MNETKTGISGLWFLLPFSICAAMFLAGYTNYGMIPDRIAMHYNASGAADGFGTKSYFTVFLLPAIGLVVTAGCFVGHIISRVASGYTQEKTGVPQFKSVGTAILVTINTLILGIFAFIFWYTMGFIKLTPEEFGSIMSNCVMATPVVVIAIVAFSIYLAVKAGRQNIPEQEYWRWGFFYVNKDDPRLLVPKRFGYGWTFNYARQSAIWLTLGPVILALLIVPLIIMLAKH